MKYTPTLPILFASALALGCGSTGDVTQVDASSNSGASDASTSLADANPNAPDGMTVSGSLPSWTLEDIQPMSAQFGQTYGLSAFSGKILVAVLVQGF